MIATAAAIIVLAGLAHGTLGFGFPIISTPLVALVVDVKTAVLVTVLPNIRSRAAACSSPRRTNRCSCFWR